MQRWVKQFAPDIITTFARFPLAIILAALGTFVAIGLTNNWFTDSLLEPWFRLAAGFSIGAVFATAGSLYGENRNNRGISFVLLAYVLPFIVVVLLQVQSTDWLVSPMLLPVGLLWLSIAAFVNSRNPDTSENIQNQFWWLNHRAITTAIIAAIAFGLMALGIVALERSLELLFGIKTSKIFYEYLLPFAGMFLTPVYWLSTIPRLIEYSEKEISEPDFLSRAIGFLGQFILTPFLMLYALILLAYGIQIILTGSLPQGMLGWMVLGFTIVGAANWLVLHPRFMHSRFLVKYFRAFWFWLTLVPIALYIVAVWIRIDAYGFTAERVGLVVGGLWAAGLTLAFLTKRFADIRLIPGIALVLLALFSVGPWNFINGPQMHQAEILDAAIHNARPITQSVGGPYEWTEETGDRARGAIRYLISVDRDNSKLRAILFQEGIVTNTDGINSFKVFEALNLNAATLIETFEPQLMGFSTFVFDSSETPYLLGSISLREQVSENANSLSLKLSNEGLMVAFGAAGERTFAVNQWISDLRNDLSSEPVFRFANNDIQYALVVSSLVLIPDAHETPNWTIKSLKGSLFSSVRPAVEDAN